MPRRSGPIRRVRNVRNTDISSIPLPYPKMWGIWQVVWGFTDFDIQLNDIAGFQGVKLDEIAIFDASDWQVASGSTKAVVTNVATDGLGYVTYTIGFDQPTSINPGLTIVVPQWSEKMRGLHGEWVAPAVLVST